MHTRGTDIADWIKQRVHAAGARGLVVGLSGGVDSAVVARLCQIAVPGGVVGAILPCHSDEIDEADARAVAAHFNIPTLRADLGPPYDRFTSELQGALGRLSPDIVPSPASTSVDIRARVPLANIKPRLRMASLYYIANSLNYLVAGTGNRSELTIGYFTKYGDGGVDLLPIGNLLKHEVLALGQELGVPAAILDKPPAAGLWSGQTDEQEMGFTYADLEKYLTRGPEAVAPALALRIERLVRATDHKRSLAPTPEPLPSL